MEVERKIYNDDVSNTDILDAMDKLSRMMDSEKKNLGGNPDSYRDERSVFRTRNNYQNTNEVSSFQEPDLVETAKQAAREIADLVQKSEEWNKETTFRNKENNKSQINTKCGRTDPQQTVNRLYELENKKRERLASMQYQKYKEELASLKSKPEISLNSKLLANNRSKQPIYMRTQAILSKKEENLAKLKKEVDEIRHQKDPEPTFQPSIKRRQMGDRPRSTKEFTNHVFAWQTKRNETLQKEQYETITREMESLTFKPYINEKSRRIVEKKYDGAPVEQRLSRIKNEIEDRRRLHIEKSTPSFRPILNEKTVAMTRNNRAKSPFDDGDSRFRETNSSQILNRSFIDLSTARQDFQVQDSILEKRSMTPIRNRSNKKLVHPQTKVHEIEYTPAMDFLLKKINVK